MADFPCASTKRTSHWPAPMSRERPCGSASLSWSQRFSSPAVTPIRRSIPPDRRTAARMIPAAILTIPSASTEQHRECWRWRQIADAQAARWWLATTQPSAWCTPRSDHRPSASVACAGWQGSPQCVPRLAEVAPWRGFAGAVDHQCVTDGGSKIFWVPSPSRLPPQVTSGARSGTLKGINSRGRDAPLRSAFVMLSPRQTSNRS